MRHLLLSLIAAAAALPFLASCSATVQPDNGYGYYDNSPTYYSTAPAYNYAPYPRYREYHPYVYQRPYEHRHVVVEHHDEHHDADIHGHIAIER